LVERTNPRRADAGGNVSIHPDAGALARAAAELMTALAERTITARGRFAVALAGGSTPGAVYALLAAKEFAARVDWPRVHVFWGDERCVPPDHPDSNYLLARRALLDHVPIPESNVRRIPGETDPAQAAAAYEQTLRTFFSIRGAERFPRFDLILLGMGRDGHTASLFPGTAALHERKHWVVAQYIDGLAAWRVTLTPKVINSAARVVFLVSGAEKAERLHEVLHGPRRTDRMPAQIVRPVDGRLEWLVDAAAAGSIGLSEARR
jgi:6-phosphogluconolactonase